MPENEREQLANRIVRRLRSDGHKAYLVGGCVRDKLLGIPPKDYDVSTDAIPQQILPAFPGAQTVGAHFGVVLVTAGHNAAVEVATFRSENAYTDGRRPDHIQFETDPSLDAQRRDFTINGLMQDPETGEVLDFTGGRQDLSRKLIRAIGNADVRFTEDHLRMLRAVRFAARLGFEIEPETAAAIRRNAPFICRISAERIRDELVRILIEGSARRGMELLDETGLLAQILPEVKAFHGVQQPPEYHPEGDVWEHVMLMLDKLSHPTATLALAVLFHDAGKPPTFRVADRIRFDGHAELGAEMTRTRLCQLKFSNEEVDQVTSLVANHMKFKDLLNMRVSTLKRFLRLPHFDEHLELHRLDCMASNGRTDAYDFAKAQLAQISQEQLKPQRLLTGRDLIAAGHSPGPAFARALDAVETAQLEGEVHTREQALALAESVLRSAA